MKALVDEFGREQTQATMSALVARVSEGPVSDEDIAYLATALGNSGKTFSATVPNTADLASTGGPTSLSTLLAPLFLRAMEYVVPKLGVPGRPAGGVDVLAQVPGYRVRLTQEEVSACLEECGYVHFVASDEYAPLDARLFRFRQACGAQNIPELVIASILAKKLAVGLKRAGLDIRVAPHGNFGGNWALAKNNALRFESVSKIAGVDVVCFLTDARFPFQPFVGRGEALLALESILEGKATGSAAEHARTCFAMAGGAADCPRCDYKGMTAIAKAHFYANLRAQGGSADAFHQYVSDVRAGHKFELKADGYGFVSVYLEKLRDLIVRFQNTDALDGVEFPDAMGVILHRMPGEFVETGDLIATVRLPERQWKIVRQELREVIPVTERLESARGFERVRHG